MKTLLIHNIAILATNQGKSAVDAKKMAQLSLLEDAAVAISEGKIREIGPSKELRKKYEKNSQLLDAQQTVALPGFVEPHTHLPFVGSREQEFEMRVLGKSYVEISQAGGGILNTVEKVRKASEEELLQTAKKHAWNLAKCGVTTVEAKSGYGLDLETELKQLRVLRRLQKEHPLDFVPTFLGAHEIPPEYRNNRNAYIRLLLEEVLPRVRQENLAEFCDIFCEEHVFSVQESRRILRRAKELGFGLKIHADEIRPLGGAELAAELGAISADHLGAISLQGIQALAKNNVVGVLLPGTSFSLKLPYAPAKKLMEAGVPLALSTDLNPGSSMTESMPLMLTLACLYLEMTPYQAITAATLNAAAAINRAHVCGTLEVGKWADIALWDIPHPRYLPYHYGVNLLKFLIKKGEVLPLSP
ncbi:MAG: imidazolonepropionase [Planctomycetota bacterium]|nr:MAG: imidazolonepropionase [Planctomycetota bacterium]